MRIIDYNTKRYGDLDIPNLMYNNRIQNIRQRRKVQLLSFMYTESRNPGNIKMERPTMSLRKSDRVKFREKFTRKTVILNSPVYHGYALWNVLPEDIQKLGTLSAFKNRIKNCSIHANVSCREYCKDIT